MKHTKLFNPETTEEFEVGKDVEYITKIDYTSNRYELFYTFFNHISNSETLTKEMSNKVFQIYNVIDKYFLHPENGYSVHKNFFSDFINLLKIYQSTVEKDRSVYNEIYNNLKTNNQLVHDFFVKLENNNIDLYPVYIKTLKGIINDIENRGKQLLQNFDKPEVLELFNKVKDEISSNKDVYSSNVISNLINLLREIKFSSVIRFFDKQIFNSITGQRGETWLSSNWIMEVLANSFMNKTKNIDFYYMMDALLTFSKELVKDIWNKMFWGWKDNKIYFKDREHIKSFADIYYSDLTINSKMNKLLSNPDAWNYVNPDFLKQFKNFDDFIQNSGIKKDGDFFSLFYYFTMMYGYDNNLIPESMNFSRDRFIETLEIKMPIRKNHIKGYVDKGTLYLYKLKPTSTNKENETSRYSRKNLIKYFGIGTTDSCIRRKLNMLSTPSFSISQDVSFIILANENGDMVGRFIDLGDNELFVNLHYNKTAFKDAFNIAGENIIKGYLKEYKGINDDFNLQHEEVRNYKSPEIKQMRDKILNKMKQFKPSFYVNDYIRVNKTIRNY